MSVPIPLFTPGERSLMVAEQGIRKRRLHLSHRDNIKRSIYRYCQLLIFLIERAGQVSLYLSFHQGQSFFCKHNSLNLSKYI